MRGMNRQPGHAIAFGTLVLALLSAAASVLADHGQAETNSYSDYARVVNVDPIFRNSFISIPEEQCSLQRSDRVPVDDRHRNRHSFAPRLVGGLIGGLIGSQFGGGRGQTALTIVGAMTGAAIAVRKPSPTNNARNYRDRQTPGHCRTVWTKQEIKQVDGYRVTYRYKGQTFVRRMDEDPGNRIRIRVDVMALDNQPEEIPSHS